MQNECSCSRTLSAHRQQPQHRRANHSLSFQVFGSVDSPSRRSDDSSLGLSLSSDERYCPITIGPIHRTSNIRNVCSTNGQSHSTRPLAVGMRIIYSPLDTGAVSGGRFRDRAGFHQPFSRTSHQEKIPIHIASTATRYAKDINAMQTAKLIVSHVILSDRASGH